MNRLYVKSSIYSLVCPSSLFVPVFQVLSLCQFHTLLVYYFILFSFAHFVNSCVMASDLMVRPYVSMSCPMACPVGLACVYPADLSGRVFMRPPVRSSVLSNRHAILTVLGRRTCPQDVSAGRVRRTVSSFNCVGLSVLFVV
jgi:hypothetical protein